MKSIFFTLLSGSLLISANLFGTNVGPLAFVNCPATPVVICDESQNSLDYWRANVWSDPIIGGNNLAEAPVDLSIVVSNANGADLILVHYELLLDLDGNGTPETLVKSRQAPASNQLSLSDTRPFDQRNVPLADKYRFALETRIENGNRVAAVRWNTQQNPGVYELPQLPYGKHRITWIASDVFGNVANCGYDFEVKDCKVPSVVCINGLSATISGLGEVHVQTNDVLLYGTDNYNLATQLEYAISADLSQNTFPTDANGHPIISRTFTCGQLGANPIRLWARDKAGNVDYCETILLINDTQNTCALSDSFTVSGYIRTEEGDCKEEVEIFSNTNAIPFQMSCFYGFLLDSTVSSITIEPKYDVDPLNGVTTYDLVLMSNHILNIELLGSPYKIIAADITRSGSITTFDLVELRRLILGVYTEFPNNDSWVFIDQSQVFTNPAMPSLDTLRGWITVELPAPPNTEYNFVAIKIGDLNGSAQAHQFTATDDRSLMGMYFNLTDRELIPGELLTVPFEASLPAAAQQFTLDFEGLELIEVLPGAGASAVDFAVFPNAITTASFNGANNFTLRFKVLTAGRLSKKIHLNSRITPAKAYLQDGTPLRPELQFTAPDTPVAGLQVSPNPFVESVALAFELPENEAAEVRIYNALGGLVYAQKSNFAKGLNRIDLGSAQLGTATGMLYVELKTSTMQHTSKLLRLKDR